MTDERSRHEGVSRRRLLSLAGGSLPLALAGCLGGDDDQPEDATSGNPTSGNSTDGSTTTTDPAPPSANHTLTGLTVGGVQGTVSFVDGEQPPITATVTNTGDARSLATVTLAFIPDSTSSADTGPVLTTTRSARVPAGEQEQITFSRVAGEVPDGQYRLEATLADETRTQSVQVIRTVDVDVELSLAVDTRNVINSGTVTLTANHEAYSERIGTVDLDDTFDPTFSVPLEAGGTTDYTLTATNIDGGAYPDVVKDITIASPEDDHFEISAGYEVQGADSLRFSSYLYHDPPDAEITNDRLEAIGYGSYAANGDYHYYYVRGTPAGPDSTFVTPDPWLDVEAPIWDSHPVTYGADLGPITAYDQQRLGQPTHSVLADGKPFYYRGTHDLWEAANGAVDRYRTTHAAGLQGLGVATEPSGRTYLRSMELHGRAVDVFEITGLLAATANMNARVYVDPETGYLRRADIDLLGNEFDRRPHIWEIVEFFGHDEMDTLDWELIKERSSPDTLAVEGRERYLEQPPWEYSSSYPPEASDRL